MILYPAIDLKDGQAVRLLRGEMSAATVFNDDPAAQARQFVEAGAAWLHLVDLDGAFAGEPRNAKAVEAILKACAVPAQLGGGIRDRATVERWLSAGLQRVILGTAAVEDPDFVREVARAYPGQVAVGIDARGQKVATRGWASETEATVTDLARAYEDAGIAASPIINNTGPSTPPASTAPASQPASPARSLTAGLRQPCRNKAKPTPDPRYSRPASSQGLVSASSALAKGVPAPKSSAAATAAATPRRK